MLILCGSSMSYTEDHVLAYKRIESYLSDYMGKAAGTMENVTLVQ